MRAQRGAPCAARSASSLGIFPSASNGPSDAQPALRCVSRTPAPSSRSPPIPSASIVGAARAHRADQVGGQQFARRFTRAHEHAQRRGRHFKMPRSDGASRNASKLAAGIGADLGAQRIDRLAHVVARAIDDLVGVLEFGDRLGGEVAPPQADAVEPVDLRRVALGEEERRHVAHELRHSADERVVADAHVLMHARPSRRCPAWSSTTTWPASCARFDIVTPLPIGQLCAMCM